MTVIADLAGRRIRIRSDHHVARLGESIPGAYFSKRDAAWTVPLTAASCVALRERFGDTMKVGSELAAWYSDRRATSEAMRDLGQLMDADLEHVPDVAPDLAQAMEARTYQRVAARFIAKGRNVLIADEMGLGKTLELIGGVIEDGVPGPYLVVTTKTATETVWARELLRWLDDGTVVNFPDGRTARQRVWDEIKAEPSLHNTWVVVHPQMVSTKSWWICGQCGRETPVRHKKELVCEHDPRRTKTRHEHEWPELFQREWGAILLDESQNALIRRRGTPTQVRNGMMLLRTRPDGLRVASSGTPMRSKPQLLWGTLNWLRPDEFRGYWQWVETYFNVTFGYGGSRNLGGLREDREALLWSDLDRIMLRRTKAEVAPDLPPKSYMGTNLVDGPESETPVALGRGVWLPLDPAQEKAYREMEETSVAILAEGDLSAIGTLAEMTRLKQFASSAGRPEQRQVWQKCKDSACPDRTDHKHQVTKTILIPTMPSNKVDYLVQMLTEMGYPEDPTGKVVVVSQYTQMLELVREALSSIATTGIITGDTTNRSEVLGDFNRTDGGAQVLLLQTRTGGVALTIDSADHMVFLDETWVPDDQAQAEDRIHRVSNPRPVFYWYLRSLGTIEEAIALANTELERGSHKVLDGRRGIEFNRRVIELTESLR